jgi:hypothetical protein
LVEFMLAAVNVWAKFALLTLALVSIISDP